MDTTSTDDRALPSSLLSLSLSLLLNLSVHVRLGDVSNLIWVVMGVTDYALCPVHTYPVRPALEQSTMTKPSRADGCSTPRISPGWEQTTLNIWVVTEI